MSALVIQPASAVGPTTLYVARTGSVGNGSSCASPGYVGSTHAAIQAALNAASTGDTVYLCAGTYSISTRLEVTKSLTIRGAGANSTVLDGGGSTQILIVQDANLNDGASGDEITATIEALSFVNGNATDINGTECDDGNRCGGAIFVENESRIAISDVHFKNNTADFIGGAVARFIGQYQDVPSTINRSSFEGNMAKLDGGAIATLFGFGLTINRSTFYRNGILPTWDARSGAAVIANFATATINESTLYDHDAPSGITVLYGDITVNRSVLAQASGSTTTVCNGSQTVSGARANLVTDNSCGVTQSKVVAGAGNSALVSLSDLKLGVFGFNGYSTKSIPLLSGSTALNHWTGCTGSDQVGVSVPQGSSCDVGASERSASQSLNAIDTSTWSYGGNTLYRNLGLNVALVAAPTDAAGQGVTYSSQTSGVCTVNQTSGALTLVSDGTCTLTASSSSYLLRDQSTADKSFVVAATAPTTTTTTTTTTVPRSTTTVAPSTTVASVTTTSEVAPTTTVSFGQTQIARVATTTTTAERAGQTAVASTTTTTTPRPVATTSAPTTTTTTVPEIAEAAPGEAAILVGGEPVESTVTRSNDQLVISAGDMAATISGITADGAVAPLDNDGNIRLSEGDQIQVEASGFAPNSDVEVWLFSTPTLLGKVTVNAQGTATATFPLPRGAESGNHRVALNGKNSDGDDASFAVGIVIGSSSGGVSTAGKVLISVPIALAVLFALVIPARRRRKVQVA